MFPKGYFSKSYFAGKFFPPAIDVVVTTWNEIVEFALTITQMPSLEALKITQISFFGEVYICSPPFGTSYVRGALIFEDSSGAILFEDGSGVLLLEDL